MKINFNIVNSLVNSEQDNNIKIQVDKILDILYSVQISNVDEKFKVAYDMKDGMIIINNDSDSNFFNCKSPTTNPVINIIVTLELYFKTKVFLVQETKFKVLTKIDSKLCYDMFIDSDKVADEFDILKNSITNKLSIKDIFKSDNNYLINLYLTSDIPKYIESVFGLSIKF